jgi:hypothetical protein
VRRDRDRRVPPRSPRSRAPARTSRERPRSVPPRGPARPVRPSRRLPFRSRAKPIVAPAGWVDQLLPQGSDRCGKGVVELRRQLVGSRSVDDPVAAVCASPRRAHRRRGGAEPRVASVNCAGATFSDAVSLRWVAPARSRSARARRRPSLGDVDSMRPPARDASGLDTRVTFGGSWMTTSHRCRPKGADLQASPSA